VPVDEAFTVLRAGARNRSRRLSELAQAIVDGTEQLPETPNAAGRQPAQGERPGRHRGAEESDQ
jgi:hypothetical protein